MAEIIARFADGRLLVQEDKAAEDTCASGGYLPFRIGHVRTVEKVLSVDAHMSGYPGERVAAPLRNIMISGDTLLLQLRRCDLGSPILTGLVSGITVTSGITAISGYATLTGPIGSGTLALSVLSGVTSGLGFYEPLLSGVMVSGKLKILANIIGY